MNEKETKIFFESIGEIWRDISTIEFLMRIAIAKKDNEMIHFPMPPYKKGKKYIKYPLSFSHFSFEIVVKKFNKRFPELNIPDEVIYVRDAMAHGLIASIGNGTEQLVKFKENKEKKILNTEFELILEKSTLLQIRQCMKEFRGYLQKIADDDYIID